MATKADQYLLDRIRRGNEQAWSEFVDRYRGRLISFARAKLGQRADAEDAVQETFISFVRSLENYRGECGLETYLFALLRRKIIDSYRHNKSRHVCLIQDAYDMTDSERPSDPFADFAGAEMTASWYARADEHYDVQKDSLIHALKSLIDGYKKSVNFRDLQIIELLFYSQLGNKDVAGIMEMRENAIALIKHRAIKQIHKDIAGAHISAGPDSVEFENLMTDIWESQRLSCPKRSTVGQYVLGTLDEQWRDYIEFHLNRLGCRFCRANLDDIQEQSAEKDSVKLRDRIMESTVGFLHKPQ